MKFGGVVAVREMSIEAVPGKVRGLIGQNGAGKTSLIDAISGFASISRGSISLDGIEISKWSVRKRNRMGIARSFQSLELFDDLSVRENLAIGCDAGGMRDFVTSIIRPSKIQLSELALEGLELCDLSWALDIAPNSLPFGKRRLVAIVRALASQPSILLLDEPAAGLSDVEGRELGQLIRLLADVHGVAVLVVEHNLEMVTSISDELTVMSSGSVLAEGAAEQVLSDPAVLDAYVGDVFEELSA